MDCSTGSSFRCRVVVRRMLGCRYEQLCRDSVHLCDETPLESSLGVESWMIRSVRTLVCCGCIARSSRFDLYSFRILKLLKGADLQMCCRPLAALGFVGAVCGLWMLSVYYSSSFCEKYLGVCMVASWELLLGSGNIGDLFCEKSR